MKYSTNRHQWQTYFPMPAVGSPVPPGWWFRIAHLLSTVCHTEETRLPLYNITPEENVKLGHNTPSHAIVTLKWNITYHTAYHKSTANPSTLSLFPYIRDSCSSSYHKFPSELKSSMSSMFYIRCLSAGITWAMIGDSQTHSHIDIDDQTIVHIYQYILQRQITVTYSLRLQIMQP